MTIDRFALTPDAGTLEFNERLIQEYKAVMQPYEKSLELTAWSIDNRMRSLEYDEYLLKHGLRTKKSIRFNEHFSNHENCFRNFSEQNAEEVATCKLVTECKQELNIPREVE